VHRLSLYLLGAPRIEQDGSPLQVDTRKAVALLVYLAVTRERQRRATLVNLLWPEYDQKRGRAALRRTIYTLNKALVGDWMEVDRQTVHLPPEADIWVDVDHFHRHLSECEAHGHPSTEVCPSCVAPLTSAVDLYHGDFLTGFGLRDSFNFDEWQLHQADLLRGELAGALERLERWHTAQQDYESALGFARRRLVLDPLDEETHARLMVLYTWSGQRTSALRQYDACARVLEEQLGIPPQPSLTELYGAIKDGQTPSAPGDGIGVIPAPSPPRQPLPHDQLPRFLQVGQPLEKAVFVAREPELAQLRGHLRDALAGQGQVVFVTGEAGSGKTTLLQEFASRAQQENEGLVVAWGRCNAHTGWGDPYLPFREILELLTGDVESRWAAGAMTLEEARRLWYLVPLTVPVLLEFGRDLIGSMIPTAGLVKRAYAFATRGSDWIAALEDCVHSAAEREERPRLRQRALFEQYTRVLQGLSEQKPLLMMLDDLQWVDNGSSSLLFHLGRRMEGSRILIAGAYRPAEVALGRSTSLLFREPEASAPLPQPGEDGAGYRTDREQHPLEPIVHELKRSFGHIEVDLEKAQSRAFVDAFLDSEPNLLRAPFRETLHQHTRGYPLFTVELLRGMQDRGDLLQDEGGRWVASGELNWDLLPARVEAVIAQRISRLPARLQEILDIACVEGETFTAEVVAAVDGAEQGQIVHSFSRLLDRRHHLVRASGLLRRGGQRFSQYRFRHILFQKYLYNRLDVVARAQLHHAVGLALEQLHGDQAELVSIQLARHFEEAGIVEKAVDYLHRAGDQARRVYANEEAQRYYRRALVLLEGCAPDECPKDWHQRTAAQLHENLGELLMWISQYDDASIELHEALRGIPAGALAWQARLHRRIGSLWRIQGRYGEALEAYDQAESMLESESPQAVDFWWQEWLAIQINRIWAYYWTAEWREIAQLMPKVEPVMEQHGSLTHRIDVLSALCTVQFRRDRYDVSDGTLATLQEALRLSQDLGDIGTIAAARFELGFAYLWRHDFGHAEAELQAALEGAERSGDVVRQTRCLTYLTVLYRMRDKTEQAQAYADRSLAQATLLDMVEYVGTAQANLAWIAWRAGSAAEVERKARLALELWGQTPLVYPFHWLALWPLIAVTLDDNQVAEATEFAQVLLQETQMHLHHDLEVLLRDAISAWKGDHPERAKICLRQAVELSDRLGYL
jgi:DNA-binding SARP family transcriptional activator